ncbi:glycosyltransferase [Dyadobacter subterraneus]|uniref:Glycosyltransferase n=1 Tax=Dyadobacter subterraneus TaxID=2773304 RepID=A0ABR9WHQ4_9BACT|nr:glycosyltransferase [Dyadobacter subterraneus]MBE9465022.1 glycosyltransferase [Dyadobacter subterraneus]
MNKKKLLQIGYSGLSGATYVGLCTVEGDINRKWDHHFLFIGIEEIAIANKDKCNELNIPYSFIHKSKGLDLKAWWTAIKIYFKIRPSAIIIHGTSELIIPLFFLKQINHGSIFIIEHTPTKLKTKAEWFFSNLSLLLSDQVCLANKVYQSQYQKNILFFKQKKISLIHNGINIFQFKPSMNKCHDSETIILGMASRLDHEKDHITILRALCILKENGYNHLQYVIIGDGPDKKYIEDMIDSLDLTKEVKLLGSVGLSEVAKQLQELDIYVHSSKGETMSLSIMQAMATGLPIVATNVEGINNNVEDGVDGLLFALGDEQSCFEKIKMLIDNPSKRDFLGNNALHKAKTEYSHISLFKNIDRLILNSKAQQSY